MEKKHILQLSRRAFCLSPLMLAVDAQAATSRLAKDVQKYVRFGVHRAGTIGEKRTAAWLERRLARYGYQTRVEPFPVRTILDPGACITLNGQHVSAFPQWFPPADALNAVIEGALVPLGFESNVSAIRIVSQPAPLLPNWVKPLEAIVEQAVKERATALIMSIDDPSDDLFVCNQHHSEPFPIPVLLIARRDLAELSAAAARSGTRAKVAIKGQLTNTNALNVIGYRPGRGKTIVISTPLTGWFQCGGERGPGVALWLHAAQLLAQQSRPVLMLGTGSHEIGHLGMEYALSHGSAPKPEDVALWLHFGASLAAQKLDDQYSFKTQQYLVGTDMSKDWAQSKLGALMPIYVTGTATTLGEAGQVIGAGHLRFVGLSGQFPTFHTPLDHGQAVDFTRLEEIKEAAAALITSVSAMPD